MADTPTTVTVDIAADLTVIRPGDTVIVRIRSNTPAQQLHDIAEKLRHRLAGVAEVVVLAGVDGIDVYRPEQERP